VDFIFVKSGKFKVSFKQSALTIEETLRRHPAIEDCAVVGVPEKEDKEGGELVSAMVVLRSNGPDGQRVSLTLEELRPWCEEHLASYKTPSQLLSIDELPRNTIGTVQKAEIIQQFQGTKNPPPSNTAPTIPSLRKDHHSNATTTTTTTHSDTTDGGEQAEKDGANESDTKLDENVAQKLEEVISAEIDGESNISSSDWTMRELNTRGKDPDGHYDAHPEG